MSITYTLEPWSFDPGSTLTQSELGGASTGVGSLAPYRKIAYPSTGLAEDIETGVQRIDELMRNGTIQPGDTLLSFSLGSRVHAAYLSRFVPTPGVRHILLAWSFYRNDGGGLGDAGAPYTIANETIFVGNQYDGNAHRPDLVDAEGYDLANQNADAGTKLRSNLHDYRFAKLDHPANVVAWRENIKSILVPTQQLPMNQWLRRLGMGALANYYDLKNRPLIDAAFSFQVPTPAQVAAATDVQVPIPTATVIQVPEEVV